MAFTVENGSGLSNANAYLSLADFKSYHDDRGNDYSSYSDSVIQQKIILATDYVDRKNRAQFVGFRETNTQALEWPRVDAYYRDGRAVDDVPIEVQHAVAEYAFRALSSTLAPDPTYDDSNGTLKAREDVVGPLSEKREFTGAGANTFRQYPMADSLLVELVRKGRELRRA